MGRPRLDETRRMEILDAFEGCLAEHGLEGTTLAKVAEAAGVQRAAIRHFVGNRDALIAAAVDHLCDKYEREAFDVLAALPPGADRIAAALDYLFLGDFVTELDREGRAIVALRAAAARDPHARQALRSLYQHFEDALVAIVRDASGARDDAALRGVAYTVSCLAEESAFQLEIGAPIERAVAARAAAATLLAPWSARPALATSAPSPARP